MNIRSIRVYALAFFSFALALQASGKILTVDMGELYNNYKKAQEAQERFNSSVESAQNEIQAMIEDGQKLVQQFQEIQEKMNNPALTDQARQDFGRQAQEKARVIQQKEMDVNQYRQQTDQTLQQRRQSIINLHLSEIREVVVEVAKTKGAELILNTNGLAVVYFDPALDITQDVLAKLND